MSRKVTFILGIILFLILCLGLLKQISSAFHSSDRISAAADDLYKLQIKNNELKKALLEVKSDNFIESQARDKLGWVREGETVVFIPKNKLEAVLGLNKKVEEIRLPNWQGWLKLFFK